MIKKIKTAKVLDTQNKTVHSTNGKKITSIASVSISQYEGDDCYYLFYYDCSGLELTDTFHTTIESAIEQAEFEFILSEWLEN